MLRFMSYFLDISQTTSREIDELLGFQVERIENMLLEKARASRPEGNHKTWGHFLHQGNQTWVGLDPQTLQTPYLELAFACEILRPKNHSHYVDLGAGYGRLAFVLKQFYPSVRFTGFEFVAERVLEGQRVFDLHECSNARLLEQDLTADDFEIPHADYYFLYDYGELKHIRKTLEQLADVSLSKPFRLIARGKGVRGLIQYENPWLSEIYPVQHEENFSIYSTYQWDNPPAV
jgi:SAM-dependent methyltransferase